MNETPSSDFKETWRGRLAWRLFVAAPLLALAGILPAIGGYGWHLLALAGVCLGGWVWAEMLEDAARERYDADRARRERHVHVDHLQQRRASLPRESS